MPIDIRAELHLHREHHVQQINAVNMAATVGLAGLALTVILSDKIGAPPPAGCLRCWTWAAYWGFCGGAVFLFAAATLHWWFHSSRIRAIDGFLGKVLRASDEGECQLILAEFAKDTDKVKKDPWYAAIGNNRYEMYACAAAGLFLIAAASLGFLYLKIASPPSPEPSSCCCPIHADPAANKQAAPRSPAGQQ